MLLYWRRQWPQSWNIKIVVNEALVFSGIFVVTQMTFAGWFHIPLFTSQAYLLLPVLLWVVFSRSQLTAATSVALMSALAIMGTLDGMGPFFRPSMNESLLSLQAFVAVITLTMMALSAALLERNAAERALKTANLNLEARVIERTTELAVSNQRLETSNIELAKNNRDLDAFAYIASHDLKSPLRGINQLATWITEDLGENLSADTKNHLQLMLSRIARMEMLLDDLLAYSRVGRSGQELILVDTSRLIDEAFDLLSPSRSFALLVGPDMPTFTTSRTPLELIFRNLIANAIKHHDRVDGTININVDALPDAFAFTVSDDGPGIPPEHQERVFGMFQTLRSRDEGSGMGLAMVRKAVECVGGTISLTSDGKRGTAFRFTWPMDIGLTQIGSNVGGELP